MVMFVVVPMGAGIAKGPIRSPMWRAFVTMSAIIAAVFPGLLLIVDISHILGIPYIDQLSYVGAVLTLPFAWWALCSGEKILKREGITQQTMQLAYNDARQAMSEYTHHFDNTLKETAANLKDLNKKFTALSGDLSAIRKTLEEALHEDESVVEQESIHKEGTSLKITPLTQQTPVHAVVLRDSSSER